MELNPYQSPQTGEPMKDQGLGESASVKQLLTEIRDAQYEMLQMNREALKRAGGMYWSRLPLTLIPMLIVFAYFFYTASRPRPLPPFPARPAPRAAP